MASIPKSLRLPCDLLAALEAWRDRVEATEGVRPSWQAAVIRLLWQALKIGGEQMKYYEDAVEEYAATSKGREKLEAKGIIKDGLTAGQTWQLYRDMKIKTAPEAVELTRRLAANLLAWGYTQAQLDEE